ncbi:4'-phosphopantetheinyl transferase superfamily protein [Cryobacterium sp. Y82]|uniref:4'-phosphopantetheinyl transferase family protein n=1 Tax=Cryobacterium sp. Y82 TaxID=2045017 RepID=UPI001304B87D|nr:4'-phosphopantetheinyl transferase superfamily protein [Cryobacterium sp. Y82]
MPQTDVSLFLAPRATLPQTDRARLTAAVALVCSARGPVTIEQRCEHCGGAHGRPRVLAPSAVHVSLSRAGHTVAVAVSLVGQIGVDIESVTAVGRAGFDDVAFNATERTALAAVPIGERDRARARIWTTKEALLKLSGQGLTVDPRELTVGWAGASVLWRWPTSTLDLSRVHVVGFDAGPGLIGTLAVFSAETPEVELRRDS